MSILKKGSKGRDIKNAQTLLNKAGAKPKLKVDGIFGPLTDAQARKFQKKCKLKVDGSIGPLTLASLKFGGKLPEMTVRDYEVRTKYLRKIFAANKKNYLSYKKIGKEIKSLSGLTDVEAAIAIYDENYRYHKSAAKLCHQLEAKQSEFKKVLLTDPGKAAKLVKECEGLHQQVEMIGSTKIGPNVRKAARGLAGFRGKLESSMKIMRTELGKIDKQKENW